MSKYFDRLVKINESLDKTLKNESSMKNNFESAIVEYGGSDVSDADALVLAFNREMNNNPKYFDKTIDDISLAEFCGWLVDVPENCMWKQANESDEKNVIPVSTDTLTDQQKKDILVNDKEVEKKVVDGMSSDELDGALKATNDEMKNESQDDSSSFVIRMDDDDLDMHGYVELNDEELKLTEEVGGAARYGSLEAAQDAIQGFCDKFHYDPTTFKVEPIDNLESKQDEVNIDDGETWISLNPIT